MDRFVRQLEEVMTREEPSPLATALWTGMRERRLPATSEFPGTPREFGRPTDASWAQWGAGRREAVQAVGEAAHLPPDSDA